MELEDKVALMEADQAHKVEELLRKQRERTTKNFEMEQSWLIKAHESALVERENRIKELELKLKILNEKLKGAQNQWVEAIYTNYTLFDIETISS